MMIKRKCFLNKVLTGEPSLPGNPGTPVLPWKGNSMDSVCDTFATFLTYQQWKIVSQGKNKSSCSSTFKDTLGQKLWTLTRPPLGPTGPGVPSTPLRPFSPEGPSCPLGPIDPRVPCCPGFPGAPYPSLIKIIFLWEFKPKMVQQFTSFTFISSYLMTLVII